MFQTYIYNILSMDKPHEFDVITYDYTGLFQKLYNNFELSKDENYINELREKFNINIYQYNNCCVDVKMSLESFIEIQNEKLETIKDIEKEIKSINKNIRLTKYQKIYKIKLERKIFNIKRTFDNQICFGGKNILRDITRLKQLNEPTENQLELIKDYKYKFTEGRKRNIFFQGTACENGNRNIDFHLDKNFIILKYNKDCHIKIKLTPFKNKKRKRILTKLQHAVDNKLIAITVRISKTEVCLTFDNEQLNGFGFDTTKLNKLKKEHKFVDGKVLWKQVKDEQTEHKLFGKVKNRCAGIDQNPDEIGFSIVDIDPITNEVKKVIFTRKYDLRLLSEAKPKKKTKKKYIRNKHKTELVEVYKDIFEWCKHYKVSYFGLEELNKITTSNQKDNQTDFNRKVKNVWYRGLQESIIKIACDEKGIIFNEVDPKYTSFIGNMMFPEYHDCIGSSIEIGRRSYTKYKKDCPNRLYPSIGNYNSEKMFYRTGVAVPMKETWVSLQKECKKVCYGKEGWWRNKVSTVGKNLSSKKSMIMYHCK